MGARSMEEKLATKVYETIAHPEFDPGIFSYYLSRCGHVIQAILFSIVKGLILQWSMHYDNGETKGGSDDYLVLTIRAKQLQETIDRHGM